jgi:predicted DNA-binding protein (MmcQ/YjbR family)
MAARDLRERLTTLCRRLPEALDEDRGDHTVYRVRAKVFAYFLADHHGDGIVSVCVKGRAGENADRVEREPERYYLPAYIGSRGWFGLRLDRARVDWGEVAEVVARSYRLAAPKSLARWLDEAGQTGEARSGKRSPL